MRIPYPKYASATVLEQIIDSYFTSFDGDNKSAEPVTLTGLALHLGFTSLEQFEDYEKRGNYPAEIRRAHLRVEQAYEKRLHQPSPTGAMFVLKTMGWAEKPDGRNDKPTSRTINVNIKDTGIKTASQEKDVEL